MVGMATSGIRWTQDRGMKPKGHNDRVCAVLESTGHICSFDRLENLLDHMLFGTEQLGLQKTPPLPVRVLFTLPSVLTSDELSKSAQLLFETFEVEGVLLVPREAIAQNTADTTWSAASAIAGEASEFAWVLRARYEEEGPAAVHPAWEARIRQAGPSAWKQDAAKTAEAEKLKMAQDMWNEKIAPRFTDVPVITTAEILELQKEAVDSVLLVDCRPEVERAVSSIPGAVPLDKFEAEIDKLSKGKVVAPFCTIGGRSAPVVQRLLGRGEKPWKELKNYELSCIGWAHSGSQFENPDGQPTNKFFVPGPGAVAMFPAGYEILTPEA